ncbi:hypothetical protein [Lewinella sp. W8]|uniref:hypothetical protein n=1 Tax=Lewinella sp. W8 TaxID=2528208 RepID=UPI0010683521|nr:hypothetical protein [Lewinella sp. W8]MTB51388.1 hypothetical protein [Lewinella sp. W8]
MRLVSVPVGDNLLEVYNNMWTGVETVSFNGRTVSRQFNWFEGIHHFTVMADDGVSVDDYRVEIRFSMAGIVVDVYQNEVCLLAGSRRARRKYEDQRRFQPRNCRRQRQHVKEPVKLWREEHLV